jgi:hypothetical protein
MNHAILIVAFALCGFVIIGGVCVMFSMSGVLRDLDEAARQRAAPLGTGKEGEK